MVEPIRLDNATYAELLAHERTLYDYLTELDKAEECGIDCQAQRADREVALTKIAALKKNYAPK